MAILEYDFPYRTSKGELKTVSVLGMDLKDAERRFNILLEHIREAEQRG